MSEIELSIIIPAYNAEETILKCVSSVTQIDFDEWEVWIIDDGSNDSTYDVCKKSFFDTRINVVTQENRGVSATRNRGIQLAKGKYIIFVDSDDLIDIKTISRNLKEMDLIKSDLGFFSLCYRNASGECTKSVVPAKNYVGERKDFLEKYLNDFLGSALLCGPVNKIYRRENLINNNLFFNEDMNLYEDILFVFSYLRYVKVVSFHPDMIYYYCHSDVGLSGKFNMCAFSHLSNLDVGMKKCICEWKLKREQEQYMNFYVGSLLVGNVKKIANSRELSFAEKKEIIGNALDENEWHKKMSAWRIKRIKTAIFIGLLKHKFYGMAIMLCTMVK